MGYEFATVNELFQKGFPRVGFLVYKRNDGKKPDAYPGGRGFHGYHMSLAALVTNSAEQETDMSAQSATVKNTGENKALEFDMELFVPLFRSARYNNGKLWMYIGPRCRSTVSRTDRDSSWEKAGGQVLGNPVEIPGVGSYVSFLDSEGNRVSMLSPLP